MANCPECNKIIIFDIDRELVSNSKHYPVPFVIEHCEKTLIAYVDAHFKVRGVQSVYNILKKKNIQVEHNHIQAEPLTPEFISNITSEEKIILTCEYHCDELIKKNIPNILEKQMIMNIAKHKEISIAILIKNLSGMEKALNRTIDQDTILKLVDKYIQKGIIQKQIVKFEKDFSTLKDVELPKGGIEDTNF